MTAVKQALAHSDWSDGVERPASYDGDSLSRAIYFSKPQDDELQRLRAENKALKVRAAAAAK